MAFEVQKLPASALLTNKKLIDYNVNNYKSITFTNTHATDAVTIDLWITSQIGVQTTIVDTGANVNLAAGYAATPGSQAVVLDATAATSDVFLNEQVWKSNGSLFGTCTVFTDATHITFGSGLVRAMTDDDSLYVGTRYYILNNVKIPNGASLKLSSDEFNFDTEKYKLYISSSDTNGNIDIIKR